jgi:probable rRNA maturation factor
MSDPSNTVLFRRVSRRLSRRSVRELAARLAREVAGGGRFCCLLADDRELRRLNRQFLGRDYPTDVLAFPSPDSDVFLGEIAVSVQRAAEQACQRGHGLEHEVGILMLHGLLHLLGMDHERDRGQMARAELRWRKKLGLPSSLIERAPR